MTLLRNTKGHFHFSPFVATTTDVSSHLDTMEVCVVKPQLSFRAHCGKRKRRVPWTAWGGIANLEQGKAAMPSIDRSSTKPFYHQVYEQIVEGIETGLYPAGKKLPSIRECARDLGVSNTTIELAYQKLTSEGYISARRGSGFTICKLENTSTGAANSIDAVFRGELDLLRQAEQELKDEARPRFDFAYDKIDRSLFPLTSWARISREVFYSKGAENAYLYNDRQGLYELRQQIAQYVNTEHDVPCIPEQVLVMPTTRDLISTVTGLFEPSKTRFVMEEPGYDEVARGLGRQGFGISWLPVQPYPNWEVARNALEGAQLVFVTSACQFPTNQIMPLDIRRKLVTWAHDHDAYIIDDEYGWEHQLGFAHLPSLSTLDKAGRVVTMGTFSNVLSPAISLSFAILPPQLMLKWQEAHRDSHPQVPWQTQAALASFMGNDRWRAHIRKMRTAMARKRETLLEALESYMGNAIEVVLGASSLFVLVRTCDGRDEATLVSEARKQGVAVYPTSRYWHEGAPDDWRYVLVGYAGIAEADIEEGVSALADAWGLNAS